jgi:glycosyltransferase involved in cell wall biosynthesis
MHDRNTRFSDEEIQEFVSRSIFDSKFSSSKTSLPCFSVVVPSYNQGKFIERTILSILNQNYPNLELIIIDGGSSDETLSIIRKYEKHISYWHSQPDKGQSDALNKGFSKASGEIFAWQNSDDIYLPGAFHAVARVFKEKTQASVCYGNWYSIDVNDSILDIHYALKPRMAHASYENMDVYNQSLFWRSEVFRRIAGFDINLQRLMDGDLMIQLMIREGKKSFYKIDSFLGAFRRHGEQITSVTKRDEKSMIEEKYIEQKYGFPAPGTLSGRYHRIFYRFAQLYESLLAGGVHYTWRKFLNTYKRRGRFI